MFNWMTKEYLESLFRCDQNGNLTWIKHRIKSKIGTHAGSKCTGGYKYVVLKGSHVPVHKIVYFLFNGAVPRFVDHIDGNTDNNSPTNLRAASCEENNRNAKIRKDNKTGSKGLRLCKNGKWQVYVRVDGKQKSFGTYEDFELADFVGIEARNKYHGNFARHK